MKTAAQSPTLLAFVHTPMFDRSMSTVPMTDAELATVQAVLCAMPDAGDVIGGTGGVRKIRAGVEGRGKRGGARVLYLYVAERETIYLILAYGKNRSSDLSEAGKQVVRDLAAILREEN